MVVVEVGSHELGWLLGKRVSTEESEDVGFIGEDSVHEMHEPGTLLVSTESCEPHLPVEPRLVRCWLRNNILKIHSFTTVVKFKRNCFKFTNEWRRSMKLARFILELVFLPGTGSGISTFQNYFRSPSYAGHSE